MKPALGIALFMLRHSIAVAGFAVLVAVLWTVVYAVLLGVALFYDEGFGGPLFYPAGLIFLVTATLTFGAAVCAPAAAVGRAACHLFRLPRLLAIPFVFSAGFGLVWLWSALFIVLMTSQSLPTVGGVMANYILFLSIPLGAYWWLTEGPGAVAAAVWQWLRSLERRRCRRADLHLRTLPRTATR
jgi:hypothetical protein